MLEIPIPSAVAPEQLQVWKVDLLAWEPHSPLFRPLLSDAEAERLERFKVQTKKNEFLISHGLLRLILGAYLGKDPKELEIEVSDHGKPFLRTGELGFNISHSGKFLLCACGLWPQIGVDIQEMYEISGKERIIERYFSPAEKDYLNSINKPSKELFFELWAAKEALLKAMGSGFQVSPAEVSLVPDPGIHGSFTASVPGIHTQAWSIKNLEIGGNFKAAAAVDGNIKTTMLIPLSSESTVS